MARRSIVIVAFDGMQPLDAIGPHEVFAGATSVLAAKKRPAAGYDLAIVSKNGSPITTESGMQIGSAALPSVRSNIDTLLIPGGDGATSARYDEALVAWIRPAAAGSVQEHHHPSGNLCNIRAVVRPDHRQRQINAGGHPAVEEPRLRRDERPRAHGRHAPRAAS